MRLWITGSGAAGTDSEIIQYIQGGAKINPRLHQIMAAAGVLQPAVGTPWEGNHGWPSPARFTP